MQSLSSEGKHLGLVHRDSSFRCAAFRMTISPLFSSQPPMRKRTTKNENGLRVIVMLRSAFATKHPGWTYQDSSFRCAAFRMTVSPLFSSQTSMCKRTTSNENGLRVIVMLRSAFATKHLGLKNPGRAYRPRFFIPLRCIQNDIFTAIFKSDVHVQTHNKE